MARKWIPAMVLSAVAMLVATSSFAATLKIGGAAPDWSNVPGVDGKKHSLSDYKDAKLIVLVFTCNHCPVAVAYEDRLIALQEKFGSKGVQVIALNVNNIKADLLEPMKKRAKDKGFNFPYIYDESQKTGRDYAATCTPHVFVLDKNRKIAYMGAVDDNNNANKAKEHYLGDALNALLAGKEPPKTTTQQRGCSIKWDKK